MSSYRLSEECGRNIATTPYLLPVHDIPFSRLAVTVHDITSFEVSILVPRFGICFRVIEIPPDDRWATYADLASYIVCSNVFTIVVD